MQNTQLKIVNIPISELNPALYNPRVWSEEATAQLTESIKRFGLIDPIIVNSASSRKNIVIGGHFRLKIAKNLGYKEVPVVHVNISDTEKEKELNLRLNRITGDWDLEMLKNFDVDMLLDVGFNDDDLSSIFDDVLEIEDDNFDEAEELKKIKETDIKEGDIFQLGKHRLICGDSTDEKIVETLMGEAKADMIYSDPPYNIGLNYSDGISNKGSYTNSKVNDNKSEDEYKKFLEKTIKNALSVSNENVHCFYWCDEKYIGLVQDLYKTLEIENKRVCLWIKNNSNVTPQIAFNKVYEPCIYGIRGKPYLSDSQTKFNEILNKEISNGNRGIDDILDLFNIWLAKRLPSNEYLHPTQKPPSLHEKPLKRCTKVGDIVLDLFGGSGSTLIACEQLNRKCYLSEIDPIFCQLIINRYENLTVQKAQKIN